jgi:PAS domain S-box-containing protein
MRLAAVRSEVEARKATHLAVFDKDRFCGIIPLKTIGFSRPERILVDLIPSIAPPCLDENASMEAVGELIETSPSGVVIESAEGRYLGLVTPQSLLKALLIEARSHSAEAARAAEERHRTLLEAAPDAMLIIDQTGTIVQTNRHVEELFGYQENELVGALVEQIVPKGQLLGHVEHRDTDFANTTRPPVRTKLDFFGRRKDETNFPIEISVTPFLSADIPYAVAAIRDITARKRAADTILRARDFYLTLLDDFPLMVWRSGLDGRCNYFNMTWLRFTGRKLEYELGDGWSEGVHEADLHEYQRAYRNAFDARQPFVLEYRLRRHDGQFRWIMDWGRAISDLEGHFCGYIGAAQDITERKESEATLREMNGRLQRTLEELSGAQEQVIQQERLRALGEMASGVAHDLNNTLSPILGYTDLLGRASDLPPLCREYVKLIQTSATDATVVVERLREFHRPSSPGIGYERIDLSSLLHQIPKLTRPKWRDESQHSGRQIKIVVEVEDGIQVTGIATELRQVFTNLVFNAVDALPSGGTLTLSAGTYQSFAVAEVRDTGVGMTAEVVARCFDPFFTTKGLEGSGLGLSVCHGIIQRHDGRIEVISQPDAGTTMRIWLPLATAQNEYDSFGDVRDVALPKGKRMLYIDDDPRLRAVMQKLFDLLGQPIEQAAGGAEGLAMFQSGDFDVVLTDLGMPEIDGREVIRIVKTVRPETRVILVTGWGENIGDGWNEAAKPDYLLRKPLSVSTLRAALAAVLG